MPRAARRLLFPILTVLALAPAARAGDDGLPWPGRVSPPIGAAATPGRTATKSGVIRDLDAARLAPVRPGATLRPTDADRADAAALLGDGAARARFEGAGSFIFREPFLAPGAAAPKDPPAHAVFVSAERDPASEALHIERTWFAYSAPAGTPRGIALLMPGLFGTPEPILELFTKKLRAGGWGVVRMLSQPSRFTERRLFEIDVDHPEASMTPIARELDDRVAECAFAAQAAMAHFAARHPELTNLPRIAIGMSGGAMTLPTVVALEPEKYAAAVMIAGGCDFFAMTDESNYKYMVSAIDYKWTPALPADEQKQRMDALYLATARLDSWHAAPMLAGKPMLMIHGKYDGAVPARLGDLLWERLGKPERWVKEAGHEEVFMKLPPEVDKIMEWVNTRAALAAATPSAPVP